MAWAKSNIVIATRLSSSYDPLDRRVQISGVHKTMISGNEYLVMVISQISYTVCATEIGHGGRCDACGSTYRCPFTNQVNLMACNIGLCL